VRLFSIYSVRTRILRGQKRDGAALNHIHSERRLFARHGPLIYANTPKARYGTAQTCTCSDVVLVANLRKSVNVLRKQLTPPLLVTYTALARASTAGHRWNKGSGGRTAESGEACLQLSLTQFRYVRTNRNTGIR
jgi:hypothetical protein